MSSDPSGFSCGLGIGTRNSQGDWLEVYYPTPLFSLSEAQLISLRSTFGVPPPPSIEFSSDDVLKSILISVSRFKEDNASGQTLYETAQALQGSSESMVLTIIDPTQAPETVPDAYLRLQLLSHRLVKPHEINLDKIFPLLPNVAWTNKGAIDLNELAAAQLKARKKGEALQVLSVDKFPKMTDYVVPSGVRIADTARVRLGAYVGEGTTVMHEGFINFNAGTIGPNMIEGRISAGVIVEPGSDLGGGCSTMGTLSGGNNTIISVGRDCLIGANAGLGIPLGDRCTLEAGLYLTAGSKVTVLDQDGNDSQQLKALELAKMDDLLFRRNSLNGRIECLNKSSAIQLNNELHAHN